MLLKGELARRALAELVGTAILVAGVVGSGIAAAELSPGDVGLQQLENAAATVGILVAIILALGAVSGAHFNPIVTLADRFFGGLNNREVAAYLPAQGRWVHGSGRRQPHVLPAGRGAVHQAPGVRRPPLRRGRRHLRSPARRLRRRPLRTLQRSARAVGAYIGGAYFFTSSTSFANPAVTVGRTLSDTFAGIAPASAPGFIVAQLIDGALAVACAAALYPDLTTVAKDVIVPQAYPQQEKEQLS